MSDAYTVRRWSPDAGVAAADLLLAAAESHDEPQKTEEWFRWKYLENPLGSAVIVVALQGDRLAGMLAFGRVALHAPRNLLNGAQSLETFVLPMHRRRGVFGAMLTAAHHELAVEGIDVAFNFPNQASLSGFLVGEWRVLRSPLAWIRPVTVLALRGIPRLRRRPSFLPVRDTRVQEPPADILRMHRRSLLVRSNSVHRHDTHETLTWRLTGHQSSYAFHSGERWQAVVRPGDRAGLRELQLLDVWDVRTNSTPYKQKQHLAPHDIRKLTQDLRSRYSVHMITVVAAPSSRNVRGLLTSGFVPIPNRIRPCVRAFTHRGVEATRCHWDFTPLDFHTY